MNGSLYQLILNKEHHAYRRYLDFDYGGESDFRRRAVMRFRAVCEAEEPVFLPGEQICFLRTVKNIPLMWSDAEYDVLFGNLEKTRKFAGYPAGNWTPNYEKVLSGGFLGLKENATPETVEEIDIALELCERYRRAAQEQGLTEIAKTLSRVPAHGATSFREALQLLRAMHFFLRIDGGNHITFGRFDRYMYPYFQKDLQNGVLTKEQAYDLLEEFFLSLNRDSDLYPGVQTGDNGQSIVLGGLDENGNEVFNELSEMCLKASKSLMMIDPKINIRVHAKTPMRIYELGSELTAAGLGFPQYSNDDIVIPGLVDMGYEYADAVNYGVAACWEFIVPGVGADAVNVGAFMFPRIVNKLLKKHLRSCETFEELLTYLPREFEEEFSISGDRFDLFTYPPAPLMEAVMDCDIYQGGKYKNLGIHGVGIATGADSLAAVEKYIYNEKRFTKEELLSALECNFEGFSEMAHILRYEAPKMGNDDDFVDKFAVLLLNLMADTFQGKVNCYGGGFRPGTGTATEYLTRFEATADGRRDNEPFGTNYSPSLFADIQGPISLIKSFAKPDLRRNINGGPLTVEFHHSLFTDADCTQKVAAFVKAFMDYGGHQLQLNVVNVEKMKAAQKNPSQYQRLVVRVWGWSAIFVDLDEKYQNQVIRRQEYTL